MSKNIILQHFNGDLRVLDKFSMENIKQYADQIGADYQLMQGKPFREHLTNPCQKVFCIDEVWDNYDNVLMLDIDVFIRKGLTLDVFKIKGNGVHGKVQERLRQNLIDMNRIKFLCPYWAGSIYKFTKEERIKLRSVMPSNDKWMDEYNQPYHFEDEGILAELACKANFSISYMPFSWSQCSYLPNTEKANMIHIRTKVTPHGIKRLKIENYKDLVEKGLI
jgi:hypothetical protein